MDHTCIVTIEEILLKSTRKFFFISFYFFIVGDGVAVWNTKKYKELRLFFSSLELLHFAVVIHFVLFKRAGDSSWSFCSSECQFVDLKVKVSISISWFLFPSGVESIGEFSKTPNVTQILQDNYKKQFIQSSLVLNPHRIEKKSWIIFINNYFKVLTKYKLYFFLF